MSAAIFIMPIRPGGEDDVRSLVRDLMTTRRVEWAQAQRRAGITRQVWSIAPGRALAVTYVEAADPAASLEAMRRLEDDFGLWLTTRMDDLFEGTLAVETLADTAPRPGPWRGWRRVTA